MAAALTDGHPQSPIHPRRQAKAVTPALGEGLPFQGYLSGIRAAGFRQGLPGQFLQLGQLRLSLDKGDIAIAQTQLAQLQQELFFGGLVLHAVKEICEQMLDILIESARIYRGDDGIEEKPYAAFYQELRNATEKSELFALVQRDTEEILLVIRTESQKRQHRLIARAKKFIFNNYANCDLSINDIAHDVGCTSSYLSKIFTDYTGENLVSYMNSYRVNMAKELLMNSQLLIREVGASVGFNTVQNFNRVFKKVTDMTPNEYRKTYQKT